MSENWNAYTLTLKPAKKLLLWLLPILAGNVAGMYALSFAISNQKNLINTIDAYSIFLIILFAAIVGFTLNVLVKVAWALTGKVIVTVDGFNLTVEKYTAGILSRKVYELGQMDTLTLAVDEKSKTYIGLTRGQWARYYYRNPILLYFQYNGSHKCIGNYCTEFPAGELRAELYKKMGKHE